eukprot:gb/GECG01016133.1/.p1 GENE.gb/GECG01016133.1/~~gb/GECG01016133.1/.p1  ORF type:complete len:769 (+),score=136.05 gb/GECG01016133.1/:1-2307(+)
MSSSQGRNAAQKRLLDSQETFHTVDWDVDNRIIKGISRLGFVYPTLVQSKCIPLGLEGKDLVVKAKTGSGKTAAYAVIILNKILKHHANYLQEKKRTSGSKASTKAVVLVPTRELVEQTVEALGDLMYYCNDVVDVFGLSQQKIADQAMRLQQPPDILVATPAKLRHHIEQGTLKLDDKMDSLVIDEADLVLSYGYSDDMSYLADKLPKNCQSFLMSATMNEEVENLKKLVLHNPVSLRLSDDDTQGTLQQFYVEVGREDKFLLLYALIKLKLVAGKAIFFVNELDSCYRLKLFLEKFSIPAAVLNAELPAASRRHILQQFNKGVFDYLIATDESVGVDPDSEENLAGNDAATSSLSNSGAKEDSMGSDDDVESNTHEQSGDDDSEESEDDEEDDEDNGETSDEDDGEHSNDESENFEGSKTNEDVIPKKTQPADSNSAEGLSKADKKQQMKKALNTKKLMSIKEDLEYAIARGTDFKDVGTVVNVDFPKTVSAYIHRIGRTARGGASGAALSFVNKGPDKIHGKGSGPGQGPEVVMMLEAQRRAAEQGYGNHDHLIMSKVHRAQPASDDGSPQPAPLPFNIQEIEGFRYRVSSVLGSVTKNAVKEARLTELRNEILHNEKLQTHFEDNPKDLAALRHDAPLAPGSVKPELANVPSYLLPKSLRAAVEAAGGGVDDRPRKKSKKGAKAHKNQSNQDPLKTFAYNANQMGVKGGSKYGNVADINGVAGALGLGGGPRGKVHSVAGRNKWKKAHKKGPWKAGKQKTSRPF